MPVFVGLDAGGTKTRLRAEDGTGKVLAEATAGPANLASTPEGVWKASLAELAMQCPRADFVAGCFAGLLTHEDRHRADAELAKLFQGAKAVAMPDYGAAVASAPPGTSVIVAAGTGSVIASMVDGRIVKSGGGGPLLGDVGSGFDIGRWGLRSLLLEAVPPDASEETWAAIEQVFGTRLPAAAVATVYKMQSPAAAIAKIAPHVLGDAHNGYQYAQDAVTGAVGCLAREVATHLNTVLPNLSVWQVGLTGGVWNGPKLAKKVFDDAMASHARTYLGDKGGYASAVLDLDPVNGAVALARKIYLDAQPAADPS